MMHRRAFTLVEVLVTLAVTAILFSLVGSILVAAITTQRKVEATLARERIGAAVLELIARDVQGMFIYDQQGVFKGTDARGGGGDADGFEFVSTRDPAVREQTDAQAELQQQQQAQQQAQQRAGAFSTGSGQDPTVYRDPPRLTKIGYSARDSRGNPGLLTVFRSESRYTLQAQATTGTAVPVAAATPPDADAHLMEVYDRVRSFNVRYLFEDPKQNIREWRDSWGDQQQQDGYPSAIEISLEIVPDPKAEEQQRQLGMHDDRARKVYRTIIAVPVNNPRP